MGSSRAQAAGLPRFAGDAVLIAGGARAILLQLAHPAVGRGVARHSDFAERPLDRLQATLDYAYAAVFGSPEERRAAARAVNRAHGPVRDATGSLPYSAYDPTLQLWVAATLYDTAATVSDRVFGPSSDREADALYEAYAGLGTALQLPRELWPADRVAFARYWAEAVPELRTDAATRALARELMFPAALPAPLRAAMPLARFVTAGLLPGSVRALYGVRWTPSAEARLQALFRTTGLVWPLVPRIVRELPQNRSLARVRRTLR